MSRFPCIESPQGGMIAFQDSSPDRLEMETLHPPGGKPPPPHYHPSQEEQFEVLEGEVRTWIAGEQRTYVAGEHFTIPRGVTHTMCSGEVPARLKWIVRPALETKEFFEAMWGASRNGRAGLLQLAVILMRFRKVVRLSTPPYFAQLLLFGSLALVGRAVGLRPWRPEWAAAPPTPEKGI